MCIQLFCVASSTLLSTTLTILAYLQLSSDMRVELQVDCSFGECYLICTIIIVNIYTISIVVLRALSLFYYGSLS